MIFVDPVPNFVTPPVASWSKFNSFLGMYLCRPQNDTLAANSGAVNDRIGIEP